MENKRLAKLVADAKGEDRSIREYASACGVNPTTISMIISKGYEPGIKILKKLAKPEAKPRNGVTAQDILLATKYSDGFLIPDYIAYDNEGNEIIIESKLTGLQKWKAFEKLEQRFKTVGMGCIHSALSAKGIVFQSHSVTDLDIRWFRPDMYLKMIDGSIKSWQFNFKKKFSSVNKPVVYFARQVIGYYATIPTEADMKFSVVLDDEDVYIAFLSLKDKISLRMNLSIILIDTDNLEVAKEDYIAFYDQNSDENSMLKIV